MKIGHELHAQLTGTSIRQLKELSTITDRVGVALAMKGTLDQTDIDTLDVIEKTLKKLRLLNILLGHLGGLSNKKLAEIHGLSAARISQILKQAKEENKRGEHG